MSTTNNNIEIRHYSVAELSRIYNVNPRTLRRWLLPHQSSIGYKIGRYYNALQVKIIFEKIGLPALIEDK